MKKQTMFKRLCVVSISVSAANESIWDGNYGEGESGNSQTASGGYSISGLWAKGGKQTCHHYD